MDERLTFCGLEWGAPEEGREGNVCEALYYIDSGYHDDKDNYYSLL